MHGAVLRGRARRSIHGTIVAGILLATAAHAQTIAFGGQDWYVRSGDGGPGPNTFAAANVSLDGATGYLHLKITHSGSQWSCAEVFTAARLGFGTYEFRIVGRPDQLDDNVVLGLFDYPTADVGPDTTNEIDIEFATWGGAQAEHGNWTVWPAALQDALTNTTWPYDATLLGNQSTHRFTWLPTGIHFESLNGFSDDQSAPYAEWTFAPPDYAQRIPQHPLPVHMNLWLFKGHTPGDHQDVDIAIAGFRFTPDCLLANGFDGAASTCS